jgi:hypothetical protein
MEQWRSSLAIAITILFLMTGSISAQWLKIPLPGTPRTPDGTPDLTAPAPRTPEGKPDLSGICAAATWCHACECQYRQRWYRHWSGGSVPAVGGSAV